MKLQKASRLFVSVVLFAACVVLVLLAQAQSGGGGGGGADSDPNKCYTEWDFCSAGTEAENAYHWQLGWCVAAAERGAIEVSVSACMGREEGTVSYPRSSSSSSSAAVASDNKCYTEWDFCSAGTEAENAYFWKLGWCAAAVERGALSGEIGHCMRGEQPKVPTRGAPPPDETQDLPWGRAYCLLTYPSNVETGIPGLVCGWEATLPPGMECVERSLVSPWDCLRFGPLGERSLSLTATAAAGG